MKLFLSTNNTFLVFIAIANIFLFLLMGIFSGFFDTLNSFLTLELSYMISPYAANIPITRSFYLLYIISLVVFTIIINIRMNDYYSKLGTAFIFLSLFMALLLVWFPMDAPGSGLTILGIKHLIAGALFGIFLVVAMLFYSFSFRQKKMSFIFRYTTLVLTITILSGILALYFAFVNRSTLVGLTEKLPFMLLILWIPLTAISLIKQN